VRTGDTTHQRAGLVAVRTGDTTHQRAGFVTVRTGNTTHQRAGLVTVRTGNTTHQRHCAMQIASLAFTDYELCLALYSIVVNISTTFPVLLLRVAPVASQYYCYV
jgi:hypothetical protein